MFPPQDSKFYIRYTPEPEKSPRMTFDLLKKRVWPPTLMWFLNTSLMTYIYIVMAGGVLGHICINMVLLNVIWGWIDLLSRVLPLLSYIFYLYPDPRIDDQTIRHYLLSGYRADDSYTCIYNAFKTMPYPTVVLHQQEHNCYVYFNITNRKL